MLPSFLLSLPSFCSSSPLHPQLHHLPPSSLSHSQFHLLSFPCSMSSRFASSAAPSEQHHHQQQYVPPNQYQEGHQAVADSGEWNSSPYADQSMVMHLSEMTEIRPSCFSQQRVSSLGNFCFINCPILSFSRLLGSSLVPAEKLGGLHELLQELGLDRPHSLSATAAAAAVSQNPTAPWILCSSVCL